MLQGGDKMSKNMGKRIAQKREEKGWSQEELGAKLNPPVTRQSISRWEQGAVADVKRSYIEQMSKLFNCDPVWLFAYEDVQDVTLTYKAKGKEPVTLMVDAKPIVGQTSKIVELYDLVLAIKPENVDIAIRLLKTLI